MIRDCTIVVLQNSVILVAINQNKGIIQTLPDISECYIVRGEMYFDQI